MTKQTVVIIIPTYNEEAVIAKAINQVFAITNTLNLYSYILVFDSSSTDKTQEIVKTLQINSPNLILKTEKQKTGLGSAYLQAMRFALDELVADIIIEFDADLSHQPQYIPKLIEKIKTNDVVIGSRYIRGGSIPKNWGFRRKLISILGNLLSRILLSPKYKDWTSGFRASHYLALKKALPESFLSTGYAYKLHLVWLMHKNKARIFEEPIDFIDREDGESKLPANSIIDSLRVIFLLRLQQLKPYLQMSAIGMSGLILQLISYNLLRIYLPIIPASEIAIFLAILNNFILNNRFTFKRKLKISGLKKIKTFTLFSSYSGLMAYLQSHCLFMLVNLLKGGYFKENLIMLASIGLGSCLNYFTYSRVIWREKPSQPVN